MKRDPVAEKYLNHKVRARTAQTCNVRQGDHFINCTGKPIDGVYKEDQKGICILYIAEKSNPKDEKVFLVGSHVATDLLKLTGQKLHTIFNPLKSLSAKKGFAGSGGHISGGKIKYTSRNKEMSEAIGLFYATRVARHEPGSALDCIGIYLKRNPERDIDEWRIKGFSTIMTGYKTSLDQMVADLKAKNPDARDFSFPLIKKILADIPPPPPKMNGIP